jgi:hypothetical protein
VEPGALFRGDTEKRVQLIHRHGIRQDKLETPGGTLLS